MNARTTISANGTSSNGQSFTVIRTESKSPEGIIIINFQCIKVAK